MVESNGIFVISLDFELYWGVRDKKALKDYKKSLLGVRSVVPLLLKLFDEYQIHATWATVGFLFFETRDELKKSLPNRIPNYLNSVLTPYTYISSIGSNELEDPFHYAPSLIKMIMSFSNQEIGSHTFSHYYCLEEGQDVEVFREDLVYAIEAAKKYNINLESLVFPRNQYNSDYILVSREMGIKVYRGNENSWIYMTRSGRDISLLIRGLRLLDTYFNISGHNSYSIDTIKCHVPFNIPSSRFLRPYSNTLKIIEPFKLRRILSDLTYAAKKRLIYHLWWHPHNFGFNIEKNILFLKKILDHYSNLRKDYGMESLNMGQVFYRLIGNSES